MLKNMSRLFCRPAVSVTRRERRLREVVIERDRTIDEMNQKLRHLSEEIRKLESTNRIQQVELDELSAVVARNLERVKAETRELGAPATGHAGLYRLPPAPQEMDTDA